MVSKSTIERALILLMAACAAVSCAVVLNVFKEEVAYAVDNLVAGGVTEAGIEIQSDDDLDNEDLYDKWTNNSPPAGFVSDESKSIDPYGYGLNVPFYMNKQSELVLYATNNMKDDKTSVRTARSYNLGSYQKSYILNGATPSESYDIPMANGLVEKELNYVKMIAFDPTGSGRDDHLAVIGVHCENPGNASGDKSLYLYVYNKKGNSHCNYLKLGEMNWMGKLYSLDNDSSWFYNASNFLSITSGDYNGDHKDTLIVWGCFDGTDYGLQEIAVTETEIKTDEGSRTEISLERSGSVSKTLLHDEYQQVGGLATSHEWVDNKLCCALDTGDLNGDHKDDLAVLSFVDILTKSDNGRAQRTQMYFPYLAVSYGGGESGSILGKKDVEQRVMKETGSDDDYKEFLTCMAASLSVGDIDGDSVDEIVVAGMKNEVWGNLNAPVESPYSNSRVQQSLMTIAAYECSGSSSVELYIDKKDANAWTREGLYPDVGGDHSTDDQVMQQHCVKCVSVNGKGNPDLIFINGDLYEYASGDINRVYESEYFKESDKKFLNYDQDLTNTLFVSCDAGNFDGNKYGREQVAFTFAVKNSGHEQYHMAAGIVGGDFSADPDNINKADKFYMTSEDTYENKDNIKVYFPSNNQTAQTRANLEHNYGLNYCICAMDNDDDGILVRFHDKGYAYTDPDIMAVLQAAPHFDELDKFGADGNSTTYSFSHSSSYEDTESNSVSFAAGVTHGLEGTLGGYDLKAGYAMDWSQEFTNGLTKTQTYSYTAKDEDAVVMYRTPVTLYAYQIKLPNGEWKNDANDNAIVLSVPGTPAYSVVTVDKYNEFAKYYNATNRKKMQEKGLSPDDAPTLALLEDSDDKKYYLDTNGDPNKYIQFSNMPSGVNLIQIDGNAFEVNTGSSGFDYGVEHYSSKTDSMSHGFEFELTISFNLGIPGFASSKLGGYASLEYMNGHSHTTTKANSTGVSCEVNNATRSAMRSAGFSNAACNSYGYTYRMAQWDSPIVMKIPIEDRIDPIYETRTVPIFGYVLSDVKTPMYAAIRPPASLNLSQGYSATTSNEFRIYGDPVPTVSKVNGDSKITYNATTRKLAIAPGLAIGNYDVKLMADNGIPGKESIITYRVSVQKPDYSENGAIASVKNQINNLPGKLDILLSDEVYVTQARASYNALTAAQKAQIPAALTNKLQEAEAQIKGFKDSVKATEDLVSEKVPQLLDIANSLASSITPEHKPSLAEIQAVEAGLTEIESAFAGLSNEQKAMVSEECTNSIAKAIGQVAVLMDKYDTTKDDTEQETIAQNNKDASDAVKALIAALEDVSSLDTANEEAFEAQYQKALQDTKEARKAYERLNPQQMAMVDNVDKLIAAEKALGNKITERRKTEVAQQSQKAIADAIAAIQKLPAPSKLTAADLAKVQAARFAYDSLSKEAKAQIPASALEALKAAEKKMSMLTMKANTMEAKGKTATVKFAKLKKKAQTIKRAKVITVKNAQGTVTYAKKKGNKKITVNKKSGKVTVKKGLKKGTYKVKVQVKAAGNASYKPIAKVVTLKIKVK